MNDDWFNPKEDLRCAADGKPRVCASGEPLWVLRVDLYQPQWMADCVTRLLIWEGPNGVLQTNTGRFWPADNDDGA